MTHGELINTNLPTRLSEPCYRRTISRPPPIRPTGHRWMVLAYTSYRYSSRWDVGPKPWARPMQAERGPRVAATITSRGQLSGTM